MKIVCDKCQTKYSIADEKVSGKVFKIRCKKCSHIIVVKGTEAAAAAEPPAPEGDEAATVAGAASAPLGDSSEKVWFLVVAGEQVGPFSNGEVRTRYAAGEVDAETYAWREGFGDWQRLSAIDDFRDLGAAANGAANGGETRRTDVGDMFAAHGAHGHQGSLGQLGHDDEGAAADIFGGAAARAPAAAARAADDPFQPGRGEARPRAGAAAAQAAAAAASAGAAAASAGTDSKLTGQRNENSVLFSLNNLTAMATAGSAAARQSSSPAPEARPGYATARNEGSGLIDIRAMAAATLSSSASSGPPPAGGAADIPSFSAAPVFTPVVAAPVMMPVPQQSGMPRWAVALVGVFGIAIVGIGAVTVMLLRKPEAPPVIAVAPAPAALPTAVAATPVVAAPAVAPAPAAGAPGAVPAAGAPEVKPAAGDHKAGAKHPGPAKGGKPGSAPVAAAAPARPEPVKVAATEKPRRKGGNDSLDDLLNAAEPTRPTRPTRAAAPAPEPVDEGLAESLEKSDVQAGMSAIKAQVMGCYGQYHVPGVALTSVTITKGKVTSASVGGALAGTPTGDCVEKAVKKASFKKAKAPLTVQYPFVLR